MVRLPGPALLSVAAMAAMALGVKALLGGWVVPRMLERGNVVMVQETIEPLESYFADYQGWPGGTPEETMWRLQGAKDDVIGADDAADGPPKPAPPVAVGPGPGKIDPSEVPSVRRQRQPISIDYLRRARVRPAGLSLGDAWGRPMAFSYVPDGPATVTSLGADGVLGTPDDVSAKADIMPRKTLPTGALFIADRELRRFELARRLQHARRVAEKQK